MLTSLQRGWMTVAISIALMVAVPAVAGAQGPHYGAGDNFSRFSGAGYVSHQGTDGEADVNVCPFDQGPGDATCDARVVTQPAASSAATASPASSSTSACAAGDVNAPSVVVSGGNGGYDPCYLQSAYNAATLAEGNGGRGQIVAIVDYSVDSDIAANLATYRAEFGLPACPTGTVSAANTSCVFDQVAQSGAPSSGTSGWDVEISLDVDTVSAICPNCQILLVEASSTSFSALGSEASVASEYYQHPGVAVTVSSGDTAGVVEFPASAPDVVAVGGTSLLQYSDQGTRSANASETVWDNTPSTGDGSGAGCSAYVVAPSWQSTFLANAGGTGLCSKRVTADVSADADPDTGVWVYDTYSESGWLIVGGTSLASPLTAALYGLQNNAAGSSVYPASDLYADASSFYHVTSGSVGSCGNYLCNAADSIDGYNGPTGLGTPGGSGALAAFDFNSAVAPGAPTGLAAGAPTATSVPLTWTASSGATSYNVYSGSTASSLSLLASGVSSASYTAVNLSPSSTYYFAVAAVNSAGTSVQSAAVSATTGAPSAPTPPTGLTATPGSGSVSLSWTAPVSNGGSPITGYTVYYSTTSGAELSGTAVAATGTTATVASLANATTYYFEVVATNAIGTSGASSQVSASPLGVPGAPTGLTATAGSAGSGKVTLAWTAPSSNGGSAITGYTVYYGTTATPSTKLGTTTATSASVTGLTSGTTYFFDVEATNANGSSAPSNVASATPPVAAPGTPGGVSARASGTSVTVSWRASSGTGPITYSVLVSTSSSMSSPTTYSAGSATSYSVTGLGTSTTYYFEVVATNSGGSTKSSVVSSKG